MLLFNILEKIIRERPRTAPGNAYPSDVNIVNIFDWLDLYWLSTKRIKSKSKTIIEDSVFVGSNSSLVAPIKLEKKSIIGAGSVITKKVTKNSLALTRAEQIQVKNYKRKK